MSRSFIKLYRDYQEDALWREKRVYSKFEAWLDILTQVQYADKVIEHIIGNKSITTSLHQSIKSLDTWSSRWGWNKSKTRRFLKRQEARGKLRVENVVKTIRITLVTECEQKPERTSLIKTSDYIAMRNAFETRLKRIWNALETHLKPDKKERKKEGEKERENTTPQTPQGAEGQNPVVKKSFTAEKQIRQPAVSKKTNPFRQDDMNADPNCPFSSPRKLKKPKRDNALFEKFWQAWPKKVAKAQAEKAFWALKPDGDLVNEMVESIAVFQKTRQWQDKQYIPYPATWLRGKRWEDEINLADENKPRPVNNNQANGAQMGHGWSDGRISPAGEDMLERCARIDRELNPEKYENEGTDDAKLRFPEIC